MEDKYSAQKRWTAENMKKISIAFTRKSGMVDALQKMESETGEKQTDYIRRAVKEQLEFDGWLTKE